MGYYVSITDSTASIPRDFEAEAVRRIHALAGKDMDFAKSGGSWQGGKKAQAWYSWTGDDELLAVSTLEQVFEVFGFETEPSADGTRVVVRFYDQKTGQEDFILYALRDLFDDGSYIRWSGEDGALFEYSFKDGDFFYRDGGWKPSEITKMRPRIFSYSFDTDGQLRVDLASASTPPTEQEKAGARFPDTTADFLTAHAPVRV